MGARLVIGMRRHERRGSSASSFVLCALGLLAAGIAWAEDVDDLPDLLQPLVSRHEEADSGATSAPPRRVPAPAPVSSLVPLAPDGEPRLPPRLREAAALQIALDRRGFGCGMIDGHPGGKTRQALLDFRYAVDTNGMDEAAARVLLLTNGAAVFAAYPVGSNDLLQVGDAPKDWEEAATRPAMSCGTLLELFAERFHASPAFLRQLNPGVTNWDGTLAGRRICVPNVRAAEAKFDVRQITINTDIFRLRGYDARGRLTCSFPCSIARDRAKVPSGELRVSNVAPHPNYTFDPANFPESARAQEIGRKLILPPGPRNPVGDYWVSLSQPGYGIHGTPHPESIGNMESHGCFRLCNWDARTLGQALALGTPVYVDARPKILR